MATRDNSLHGQGVDSRPTDGRSITVYDVILAVIPLAFAVSLAASQLFAISLVSALVPASVVGAAAMLDALFVHPPNEFSEN